MRVVASIFSGAGGLDAGFVEEGFSIDFALDSDRYACATYAENLGLDPIQEDIRAFNRRGRFGQPDLVIGGPPCEGVSNFRGDLPPRRRQTELFSEFFRFVAGSRPLCFAMENVRGLATMYSGRYLLSCLQMGERAGYNIVYFTLNSKDFGVAQSRTRVFLVGFRADLDVDYRLPTPTHGPLAGRAAKTIRQALRGLEDPNPGEVCTEPFSPVYWTRNRRRGWDEVSWVIPASCKHVPLHPESPELKREAPNLWKPSAPLSEYRRFSWRECAAIQGFPRGWPFLGNLRTKYRLVGNAVPPPMARALARSIARAKVSERRGGRGELRVSLEWGPAVFGFRGAVTTLLSRTASRSVPKE